MSERGPLVAGCGLAVAASVLLSRLRERNQSLGSEEYLVVQQIYRGWAWLALPIGGALFSTVVLTASLHGDPSAFRWALASVLAIGGTQIIFWVWTYPVNVQTRNWTMLPEHWTSLRARWEYSHAAGELLDLGALVALVMSLHQSR